MWGEMSEREVPLFSEIIAIKGSRVSEFGNKSLNADYHSQLFINPKCKQTMRIRKWYDHNGRNQLDNVRNLTVHQSRGDSNTQIIVSQEKSKHNNLNFICEISDSLQEENDVDKHHFFFLNGYVCRIKNDEKIFYNACPND